MNQDTTRKHKRAHVWTVEQKEQIDACCDCTTLADGDKFSELEFIDSLAKRNANGWEISDKQAKLLERIYNERVLCKPRKWGNK